MMAEMADKESNQLLQSSHAETTNVTIVHGDGSVIVNAGSGSTVTVTTCPQHVHVEENYATAIQECVCQKHAQKSQPEEESRAIVSYVPKPVGKPRRLNTRTRVACRMLIDKLAQLSAEGKVLECSSIIAELMKTKTEPDFQVSLRHAASLNAINEGKFKKANCLLNEAESFIPYTRNEVEHRLRWYQQKSMVKMREGNCDIGIVLTREGLSLLETVAPGCMTAWLLLNHARFLTEIAAGQDDDKDRRRLMEKAEKEYRSAIEHAECEHPKQMLRSQSRVPLLAKIGLAHLYLGCRESVDSFRLGVSTVSDEDIEKAKNIITDLDKKEMVCNVSTFLLLMAKSCLHYRQGSYQQAYDLAQEAKVFATEHSFGAFINFADSTIQFLMERKPHLNV